MDVPVTGADGAITWPENTVLTTGANGKLEVAGLDGDTYYLREVKAPAGYNVLAEDVEVKIAPTVSDDGKALTLAPVTVKVENKSGAELPSTGGIGTTIFYVLGGLLVVCAGVLSVVCFCAGLTGSYLWGTPVGATVVLVNLAVFLLTRVISRLRKA